PCGEGPPRPSHVPRVASTAMLEAVALPLIRYALSEDVGTGDITSLNTIRSGVKARAAIVAKQKGTIAGVDIAGMTFHEADGSLKFKKLLADGSRVEPGAACAQVVGDAGSILKAERTALNFMQHLSGVATLTRKFADAVDGTGCRVLDTRK